MRPRLLLITFLVTVASCGGRSIPSSEAARWSSGPNVGRLDLLAVDFINAQTGWAVGEIDPGGTGGAIYQTLDGGRSWHPLARTNEILASVNFVSPKLGFVAGHAGRIERTDDGGLSWKAQRMEREGEVLNSI